MVGRLPARGGTLSRVSTLFAARMARFTNRILGPITWHLPGFGRIEHRGRISGRVHSAPMMAFRSADGRTLRFALVEGTGPNWVQNTLISRELTYVSRWTGRVRLTDIRIVRDPDRRDTPRIVRAILGAMHVEDFLEGTVHIEA